MDIFFSFLHSEKIEGSNGAATPSARKWPFSSSQSFRISFRILNGFLGSRYILGYPQISTLDACGASSGEAPPLPCLLPSLMAPPSGLSQQCVGQAAGVAGPLRCRALPRPQPAAPLQGSPLLPAVCRCRCICVAYRTALATCVASFSSCASSRYRSLPAPPTPHPTCPAPTYLLKLQVLPHLSPAFRSSECQWSFRPLFCLPF